MASSTEHTSFRSDNIAGASPQILAALTACNEGVAIPYGGDEWTHRVEEHLARVFERKVGVLLVNTGTAANSLALAAMTPPWGSVLCHRQAHIHTDECGAPEFFGAGLKLLPSASPGQQARSGTAGHRVAGRQERCAFGAAGCREHHAVNRDRAGLFA